MKLFLPCLKIFILLTLLTGLAYPLSMTGLAQYLFSKQANGTIIYKNNQAVGSLLIAQKFESEKYFWPRPSSADYSANPSGSTNLGPTSTDLKKQIDDRRAKYGQTLPPQELITASGSGLDPHISPEGAHFQVNRVASSRHLNPQDIEKMNALIDSLTEKRDFGVLGEPRVNVLKLNLALDQNFKE